MEREEAGALFTLVFSLLAMECSGDSVSALPRAKLWTRRLEAGGCEGSRAPWGRLTRGRFREKPQRGALGTGQDGRSSVPAQSSF